VGLVRDFLSCLYLAATVAAISITSAVLTFFLFRLIFD
jgi:hypothetical protein